ncbi:MAG: hypothetical protein C4535_14635 [Comamonadaceae bacterium]|nr:MAG: hypothetical protein C4535_14635 [Comamonadaceae bacterium]
MALIRTRYRKQSTLTYLATSLATVNQELGRLQSGSEAVSGSGSVVKGRRRRIRRELTDAEKAQVVERIRQLEAERTALFETIRQFDPELDPSGIGGFRGASA